MSISFFYINTKYVYSQEIILDSLVEKYEYDRLIRIMQNREHNSWIFYLLIPIRVFIKIFFVASCLWISIFFAEIKLSFRKLIAVSVGAEIINLVPSLLKIGWFTLIKTEYTLNDLQRFPTFSALSLFEREYVEKYLMYPLHLLSIWELAYWILLAYGLSRVLQKPISEGMRLVAVSYGPALALWVLFVVFLSVNLG